jgi:histidine ammonia-lyase
VTVTLTGNTLSLDEVVRVARGGEDIEIDAEASARMQTTREVVERVLERGDLVYGISTGVGARKRHGVTPQEQDEYNRAMIETTLVGQGPAAPEDAVRATLVRLVNGFAKGTAGVRPELAERLAEALNAGACPAVRMIGSNGQSDLAPMAELAHGLLGDFHLAAKEAIALINNNAFSTGLAALAVNDYSRLLDAFDVAGALDLEAFAANVTILHPAVAETRPYPGLQTTLTRLRALLGGSYLWAEGAARNLQDPLTFRGLPHVLGAARDMLAFAEGQLAIELNASQENPLVVEREERIISVANFEVLPLAAALDCLRIALAPVVTSACERLVKLLQATFSGLPEGLSARGGIAATGFPEFAYPAVTLAAEARLLAQPVSFEVVTTSISEGIEDRMTMAPLAARRLAEMVALGERVLAIELTVAAQAVDLRSPPSLGAGTRQAYELVREHVPFTGESQKPPSDLESLVDLIRSGVLSGVAR